MWNRIAGLILRNRILLLVVVGLVTSFMAYKAQFVEMSYTYAALLPDDDPASIEYEKFKNTFGQEGNMMFFAVQDPDFYELDKFNDWIALGESLNSLDGIDAVVSIAHTWNINKNKKEKRFEFGTIFPHQVKTQAELDSLAAIAEALPFYHGSLINKESNTYLMGITVNAKIINSKAREPMVAKVREITDAFTEKYGLNMKYSGLPYIRVVTAQMIKGEMNMFIYLSLLVTAVILFMFFRSFKVVFFCMLVVGLSVIWAVGSMVLFDYKITLLTAMLPPLLVVIGIPNSVFLINKYHGEYIRHNNKIKALQRVVAKIGNATFLTNLTTASGFATFIVTSSQILKEFGVIAALNIMVVFVLSLLLIPIIFSFLAPPDQKATKHLDNKMTVWFVGKLEKIVLSHRSLVYAVAITLLVLGGYGISKIKSTGYMVDDLPHDNEIYQDLKFFEKNMDGIMPLEVMVETRKKAGVLKTSTLKRLNKLNDSLRAYPEISGSVSVVEAAKFANQAYFNGKEKYYKLPSNQTKDIILSYLAKAETGADSKVLETFVDSTQSITRMSFRMKDIGTTRMADMEKTILGHVNEIFPKDKYTVHVTGSSIVFFKGTQYLIKNLFLSLALAIFLIASFMAWMFSSKRMVMVALIPNLLPLIVTAALMGYFGIPIKASTILVFSIAFGISVDDTIHYLAKYRQELKATNWSIRSSVVLALRETGQSMMYTSIILFFGFSIFALSEFGGTVSLGVLVSLTLLSAMLSNLVLLPSLLLTLEKAITNRSFKEPLLQIFDEEEDIELDDLRIAVIENKEEEKESAAS
ncbi:efflux RND transporter permease subunit [Marinifilum sp. D737]|uniref:efflux RND transporter permease subunit n=1 Tax=Marinifilum sp. D737 TaxID=2969628 RepID=UPI0022734049|nr:efflux RND transporter permease subunit [Marinifilum sp. D737]MCY1634667.1 efflux RND transporter permease subunit [Marinifilum sp. D737]